MASLTSKVFMDTGAASGMGLATVKVLLELSGGHPRKFNLVTCATTGAPGMISSSGAPFTKKKSILGKGYPTFPASHFARILPQYFFDSVAKWR